MGMYFSDFGEGLSGECGDDVRDAEFLFADDPGPAALEEFVVGEQASGDGVLDGGDSQQGGVCGHAAEEDVETRTGEYADLSIGEVAPGGGFVIASCDALYGDLLHVFRFVFL